VVGAATGVEVQLCSACLVVEAATEVDVLLDKRSLVVEARVSRREGGVAVLWKFSVL